MASRKDFTVYDDVLMSMLRKEESVLSFLSAIFNFLARRTDFYYVPKSAEENMGFPPGVAEQLVLKVVKACDPKTWAHGAAQPSTEDISNEIMCSTVAQEVEVVAEENDEEIIDDASAETTNQDSNVVGNNINEDGPNKQMADLNLSEDNTTEDYVPPVIPTQRNSESYNGAATDKYSWSQTIMDLDVTVPLPPDIKKSKDLKVTINASDITIQKQGGENIIKDTFPFKIKPSDSFWSITEGKLLIHLEKCKERWWKKLLDCEEEIDLDKIDCSRPLDELPEDHIAKVRELQWNQERKMKGLPTSDEIRNIDILKKAWNADGSPFKGTQFDPNVLHRQ